MNNAVAPSRPFRRLALRAGLGAAVVVSLAGAYAFKTFFARPGEAAIRLIPADAVLVGSIDLVPSPQQALTFKSIEDALNRNGMSQIASGSFLDVLGQSPVEQQIRTYALRSGALGLWMEDANGRKEMRGAALVALSDGAAVDSILAKQGQVEFYRGLRCYHLSKGSPVVAVFDDVLAVSTRPEDLYKIKLTHDGGASVANAPDFQAARQRVVSDANLMVFVSPKLLAQIPNAPSSAGVDWTTADLAIRDGGIEVNATGAADPSKSPMLAEMAKAAPIRSDLFQVLPSGAYGVTVMSQPGRFFKATESTLEQQPQTARGIDDAEQGLRKQVGIDVHEDILPALQGTSVLAAYPSDGDNPSGVNLLAVVDDQNGANPTEVVNKLRRFAERQMEKDKPGQTLFTEADNGGAHEVLLAGDYEKQLRDSFGHGAKDSNGVLNPGFGADKTVGWATVGNTVIAATSKSLLDRAVASYEQKAGSLHTDPAFAADETTLLDGSQAITAFNLGRIATGVENSLNLASMDPKGRDMVKSILDAFKPLSSPLYLKSRVSPDGRSTAGVFIPLDYAKMIDLIGAATKKPTP